MRNSVEFLFVKRYNKTKIKSIDVELWRYIMDIDLTGTARKPVVFGNSKKEVSKEEQKPPKEYNKLLNDINEKMVESVESVSEEEIIRADDVEVLDRFEGLDKEDYERKYKSGEVANILNITDQTLRNMCQIYTPLLGEIERTPAGHRIYRKKDIDSLRQILEFKKTHEGYSNEQILRALLLEKIEEYNSIGPDTKYKHMEDMIKKAMAEIMSPYTQLLLADKEEQENEIKRQLEELKSEQEKAQEELKKKIEEQNQQISDLVKLNQNLIDMMNNMTEESHKTSEEQNEQLLSSVRELLEERNKKKGLFSWLK